MNECGECSACCNWPHIAELKKPAHQLCSHHASGRCSIYGKPERPAICADFRCAWHLNDGWPAELRPDRCGVMFEPCGLLNEPTLFLATVGNDRPDAWKTGHGLEAIKQLLDFGFGVIVQSAGDAYVIAPKGKTPEAVQDEFNAIWESFTKEGK